MITNRMVSLLLVVAVLICLAVIALPWRSAPGLANFSGRVVYASAEKSLEFSGRFNLYGHEGLPEGIKMKMVAGGKVQEMDLGDFQGAFSGTMEIGPSRPAAVEARLELDGKVIATGWIPLPRDEQPSIHILRFSSIAGA